MKYPFFLLDVKRPHVPNPPDVFHPFKGLFTTASALRSSPPSQFSRKPPSTEDKDNHQTGNTSDVATGSLPDAGTNGGSSPASVCDSNADTEAADAFGGEVSAPVCNGRSRANSAAAPTAGVPSAADASAADAAPQSDGTFTGPRGATEPKKWKPASQTRTWETLDGGIQSLVFACTFGAAAVVVFSILWIVSVPWITWCLFRRNHQPVSTST